MQAIEIGTDRKSMVQGSREFFTVTSEGLMIPFRKESEALINAIVNNGEALEVVTGNGIYSRTIANFDDGIKLL